VDRSVGGGIGEEGGERATFYPCFVEWTFVFFGISGGFVVDFECLMSVALHAPRPCVVSHLVVYGQHEMDSTNKLLHFIKYSLYASQQADQT
jgi:hypothetical protein